MQRVYAHEVTSTGPLHAHLEGFDLHAAVAVSNDPVLWTMLNAIKEQQHEIEQLQGELRQHQAATEVSWISAKRSGPPHPSNRDHAMPS